MGEQSVTEQILPTDHATQIFETQRFTPIQQLGKPFESFEIANDRSMKNIIKTDGKDNVLELQLNVLVFQQGEYFVSLCPSLNLSSYGDSIQSAKEGFDEVMTGYVQDCERNKSLRKDLLKLGWTYFGRLKVEPPAQVELDIPGGALKKQFNENWKVPVC